MVYFQIRGYKKVKTKREGVFTCFFKGGVLGKQGHLLFEVVPAPVG